MAKCAVIGAKGFIGKHLAFYLNQQGHQVDCYDIFDVQEKGYVSCDLTKKEDIRKINLNVDYIFMFAGLTGTFAGFDRYESYILVNEIGLLNLLDAIRLSEHRPKIIFPSTRLVYKGQEKALKEDDEKETKTIYAVNKLACEGILQAYSISFDIPYTTFRICVPFGNMLAKDYSFGTIGFMIRQARDNKKITLYGDGEIKRTFTSMKDVCRQIVGAGMKSESDGEIYNIGGQTHSLKEAAYEIAEKYGAEVAFIPYPETDLRIESGSTYFDSHKIESLLGEIQYDDINTLFE